MKEILTDSVYFGVAVSLLAYMAGMWVKKKMPVSFMNPLLVAMLLVIKILMVLGIDYETYDAGAKYITYFLTPATICLAVPLYKQFRILKQNKMAILLGIFVGCLCHGLTIIGLATWLKVEDEMMLSLLSKSVTTPIALGICHEVGGVSGITVLGTTIAGLMGAIVGPAVLKVAKITEPVAQGLGIGAASHAVGTSKMVEVGEVQAAMSSLAIVVTGLMTVVVVPILLQVFL